jgi:hypothetical protein
VALPHCETEGVKLAETHEDPVGLLLDEELRDAVTHALCVALPHCDTEGETLSVAHAELLGHTVTEDEEEGVNDGECVSVPLPLKEAL